MFHKKQLKSCKTLMSNGQNKELRVPINYNKLHIMIMETLYE